MKVSKANRDKVADLLGAHGIDKSVCHRVVSNPYFNNATNEQFHFPFKCLLKILRDAANAGVPGKSLKTAIGRLQQNNIQALGNLAEIVCGLSNGKDYGGLKEWNRIDGNTDDDWVGKNSTCHQVKHSVSSKPPSYRQLQTWCAKRRKAGYNWSQLVIWAGVPFTQLSKRTQKYINGYKPEYQVFQLDARTICK